MIYKLEVRHVKKTFATRQEGEIVTALQDVSLSIRDGEFVSIVGPSGCGKSTLLDMIAGLSVPDDGDILLNGTSIVSEKGHVSYMPQKDSLFPWRTILDNVIVPLQVQGVRKKEARQEALALLPDFGLEQFADHYPFMLSGGMRQRASFLRTYLQKKDVMLLDEPFASLDALTRMKMQEWLMKMWQTFQHAVLLVTHSVDEALLLSDRIYVFSPRPGRVLTEISVDIPRPRAARTSADPSFTSLKKELLHWLEDGISHEAPVRKKQIP
ncbi:MAG: ABC transporter ATP-binding protein [Bacillaceae bacterium]|nr:ABC transporter ATP-binding protein [Bacillaceae bacterium]